MSHSKEAVAKYARTPRGKAATLLRDARRRARTRNLPFTVAASGIARRVEHGVCEATGISFEFDHRSPFAPSLDQIDPGKGYTDQNVRVVVSIYNFAKHDWSDADVRSFIQRAQH